MGRETFAGFAPAPSKSPCGMRLLWLLVVLAATGLRAALVWTSDASPTEAYYELCSQRPAPAYFDGPAGTARLIESTSGLGEKAWRLWAPLWGLLATLASFGLVRRLGGTARAGWVAVALNLLPIFNWSALEIGPQLPALTFVLLGIWWSWNALDSPGRGLAWWMAAGCALGAGSLFAYAAAAAGAGIAGYALIKPDRRRSLPGLFIGAAILGIFLAPALLWNAGQDWIPLAAGTFRTLWAFDPAGMASFAMELVKGFSPLILPGLLLAWLRAGRQRQAPVQTYIFWAALPGVLPAIYFVLRGQSGLLWLLLASPLLLLACADLFSRWPRVGTFVRVLAMVVAAVWSVMTSAEVERESTGWRAVAAELRTAFFDHSEGVFLVAQDPAIAAILGHHLARDFVPPRGYPVVFVKESQDISNQFDLWPGYEDFVETDTPPDVLFTEAQAENPFTGRNALYVTREPPDLLPQSITAAFASVSLLEQVPRGEPAAESLYIYLCLDYQTLPL